MNTKKPERGASKDQILIQVPSELKSMVAPILALLDSAKAAMRACSGGRAVDYVAIEQTVEEMTAEVERSTHETILRSLEVDSPRVTIRGRSYRRVGHGLGTYYTKAGEVKIMRALYRESGERRGKALDACRSPNSSRT